ncbi:BBSome complex assembly protein BBS10-like [Tubulanus polymorphus]|uniref:BBSome complex assembly protein BBS10-like n=1 Tax=Tubulanus polymorphus TaxID=672921 RepID=UPI003DA4B3AA
MSATCEENEQLVGLKELIRVCSTLKHLLKRSFGPCSTYTLITTSSGRSLITADGYLILSSLNYNHPVDKLIIQGALRHHKGVGDGIKTFILILGELVNIISTSGCSMVALARQCTMYRSVDIQRRLLDEILSHCSRINLHKDKLTEIFKTSLTGKYNSCISELLSDLLSQFIIDSSSSSSSTPAAAAAAAADHLNYPVIEFIIEYFDNLTAVSIDSDISISRVNPGLFIPGNKLTQFPSLLATDIKFIIVDECDKNETATIEINNESDIVESLLWRQSAADRWFKRIKDLGVDLILITSSLTQSQRSQYRRYEISVLESIDVDDLRLLQRLIRVLPVTSFTELISDDLNIGVIDSVKPMNHGLYFIFNNSFNIEENKCNYSVHSLSICAPDHCQYKTICNSLRNCLKYLKTFKLPEYLISNTDPPPSGACSTTNYRATTTALPPGGVFEYLISRSLRKLSRLPSDVSLLCRMLSDAVLIVPQIICENSYNNSSFIKLSQQINEYLDVDCVKMINCRTGNLNDVSENDFTESVYGKLLLLQNLVELLREIILIDSIVPVKQIQNQHDESEDD